MPICTFIFLFMVEYFRLFLLSYIDSNVDICEFSPDSIYMSLDGIYGLILFEFHISAYTFVSEMIFLWKIRSTYWVRDELDGDKLFFELNNCGWVKCELLSGRAIC